MIEFLKGLYDIMMPRYITENVAMFRDEEGNWCVLCREIDLMDDDVYECIGVSRCFNFFGFAIRPSVSLPEGF